MPRVNRGPLGRDLLAIHRLEYPFPINYVCQASWGACFAVKSIGQLASVSVLAAVVANYLLIVSVLALNTAADIRTDERHPQRGYLASTARRFGRIRVLRWAGTEMACALVLTIPIAAWSGRWFVPGTAAAIIVLQLLYNLEPIRLKRRGFVGPIAFCASVILLPCLLSYSAVRFELTAMTWLTFLGLGIMAIGRMTWWAVPDLTADAATGMTTPAVRYGAVRSLVLSCLIMATGLILLGGGLWWRFGPAWALAGMAGHAVFLSGVLSLLHGGIESGPPNSVRMRKRAMPLVMVGDMMLVIIPLIAG